MGDTVRILKIYFVQINYVGSESQMLWSSHTKKIRKSDVFPLSAVARNSKTVSIFVSNILSFSIYPGFQDIIVLFELLEIK